MLCFFNIKNETQLGLRFIFDWINSFVDYVIDGNGVDGNDIDGNGIGGNGIDGVREKWAVERFGVVQNEQRNWTNARVNKVYTKF